MRKMQQGFTLIELVVVITILGILSAFAIPRFTQLQNSARASAITALGGSLKSAAALAHAQYLALGTSPATIIMDGQTITLSNGYPDVPGIPLTLQDTTGFTPVTTATTVTYQSTNAPTPASCSVTYTVAPSTAAPATVSAPNIAGC